MTREQLQQIKQPRTGLNCYVGPKNTRGYRKYSISIMLNLPIKLELTEILECFRVYLNRADQEKKGTNIQMTYFEAISQPAHGPDEVIFNDGRLLVERENNRLMVTGIGIIAPPFNYCSGKTVRVADLDSLDNVQTVLPNHAARETREELLEDTLNAKGTEDSTGYPRDTSEGLEVETILIEEVAEITAEEWPGDRYVDDELQDI